MARNQGGAQLSFLIVSLILNLGLAFVVFSMNGEYQNLLNQKNTADANLERKDGQIKDQAEEIVIMRGLIQGSDDLAVPSGEVRNMIDKAGSEIATAKGSSNPRSYASLTDLYADSIDTIRFLNNELNSQRSLAEAKDQEYVEVVTSKSNLGTQLNEEIDSLRGQVNDFQVELEGSRSRGREESQRLLEENEQLVQDHSAVVYKLQRDLSISENLLQRANDRIEELKREIVREETFAMVEPDGEILNVSEELGKAWISLGTKNKLRRGLVFDVFAYQKGGKRISKGRVEVLKVEADFSEVAVLENLDRFNPISAGDQITSPFFDQDEVPHFVFAGEAATNGKYSVEEMVRKIELFGGVVSTSVALDTDFFVAAKGYEETEESDLARDLGVNSLREGELLYLIDL